MRTAAQIFSEIRFNTNNSNDDRIKDPWLLIILNRCVREIQKIVFLSNPKNNPFTKPFSYAIVNGQEIYPLPPDIFSISCIADARLIGGNGQVSSKPLRRLSLAERARGFGYIIVDKNIYFSPIQEIGGYQNVEIFYMPKLPQVTSVNGVPPLPDVCEEFIVAYLERKIQAVDSSSDTSVAINFTKEEKQSLMELFSAPSADPDYSPITDETYLNY